MISTKSSSNLIIAPVSFNTRSIKARIKYKKTDKGIHFLNFSFRAEIQDLENIPF